MVRSIVGVTYHARQVYDRSVMQTTHLDPYTAEGDLLADPGQLMAVVRTQHATIAATIDAWSKAAEDVICVDQIEVSVWCLTRAEADQIEAAWETLPAPEEHLELLFVDPIDTDTVLLLSEQDGFVPVAAYPPGATVLPGEVGRDRRARYLTEGVITPPDPVDRTVIKEAQVHLVLADGTETDVAVRAEYTGASEEPLALTYSALTPRHRSPDERSSQERS